MADLRVEQQALTHAQGGLRRIVWCRWSGQSRSSTLTPVESNSLGTHAASKSTAIGLASRLRSRHLKAECDKLIVVHDQLVLLGLQARVPAESPVLPKKHFGATIGH